MSGTGAPAVRPVWGREPRIDDAKLTFGRVCKVSMSNRCPRRKGAAGQLRVMEKTNCWRTRPNGHKRQNCVSCVKNTRLKSEGKKPAGSRRQVRKPSRLRTVGWRWILSQTVAGSGIFEKERSRTISRKIEESTDRDEDPVVGQKEKWQQELLHIERRRNDLWPEHEKMQRM